MRLFNKAYGPSWMDFFSTTSDLPAAAPLPNPTSQVEFPRPARFRGHADLFFDLRFDVGHTSKLLLGIGFYGTHNGADHVVDVLHHIIVPEADDFVTH